MYGNLAGRLDWAMRNQTITNSALNNRTSRNSPSPSDDNRDSMLKT